MVIEVAHAFPGVVPKMSEAESGSLWCFRASPRRSAAMMKAETEVQSPANGASAVQSWDDKDCLYRVARGDRSALAQLYAAFAPVMLGLACRIVRDHKEAEDVIHDVFVEAWKRAGDYDPSRSSVKAWLLMMVRSRALDRVRSARAKHVTLVAALPEGAQVAAETNLGERRQLHGALARLTMEQQSVLELGYFQGLSSREIANVLGIPIGTVKSRVAAALGQLRDMLGSPGESAEQQ